MALGRSFFEVRHHIQKHTHMHTQIIHTYHTHTIIHTCTYKCTIIHLYIVIKIKTCCQRAIRKGKKRMEQEKKRWERSPAGFAAPKVRKEEDKKRIRGEESRARQREREERRFKNKNCWFAAPAVRRAWKKKKETCYICCTSSVKRKEEKSGEKKNKREMYLKCSSCWCWNRHYGLGFDV